MLLILAVVSIAMLTGDNGILTKAQYASNETRESLLQDLKSQGILKDEEYQSLLGGESIEIETRTITLEEEKTAKTLVQAFKDNEIHVGDYLNYSNPVLGKVTLDKKATGYSKAINA